MASLLILNKLDQLAVHLQQFLGCRDQEQKQAAENQLAQFKNTFTKVEDYLSLFLDLASAESDVSTQVKILALTMYAHYLKANDLMSNALSYKQSSLFREYILERGSVRIRTSLFWTSHEASLFLQMIADLSKYNRVK